MNFIKNFLQKRSARKNAKALTALLDTFKTFDKAEKGGLIAFDVKTRRLFIEEPLASVMMTDEKEWGMFLRNCFYWLYYRQCNEAWSAFFVREELKAVHRARRKYPMLTSRDVMRIRFARRDEIASSDMQPPKVEPFEFFVIRMASPTPSDKDKQQEVPSGEIMAVGSYDGQFDEFDIAAWSDVKAFLDRSAK